MPPAAPCAAAQDRLRYGPSGVGGFGGVSPTAAWARRRARRAGTAGIKANHCLILYIEPHGDGNMFYITLPAKA